MLVAPRTLASSATVQSLYELIGERSPGERTSAQLTKLKRQKPASHASARAAKPSQRALGKINRPAVDADPEPVLDPLAESQSIFSEPLVLEEPVGLAGLLPAVDLPGGVAEGLASTPGVGGSSGGGGVIGGASGSGGTGGGGSVDDGTLSPPIAAVPEPATWAMMILGFGLCAAALRRRATEVACRI